jgi:hypothetical protein
LQHHELRRHRCPPQRRGREHQLERAPGHDLGNTIQQIENGYGISVFGSGAGIAHTVISSNLLRNPAGTTINQLEAIDLNYSTQTPTSVAVCSNITGNTIQNRTTPTALNWGQGLSGTTIHLASATA